MKIIQINFKAAKTRHHQTRVIQQVLKPVNRILKFVFNGFFAL